MNYILINPFLRAVSVLPEKQPENLYGIISNNQEINLQLETFEDKSPYTYVFSSVMEEALFKNADNVPAFFKLQGHHAKVLANCVLVTTKLTLKEFANVKIVWADVLQLENTLIVKPGEEWDGFYTEYEKDVYDSMYEKRSYKMSDSILH